MKGGIAVDIKKEKQDAEEFIAGIVKNLAPEDKQRVLDILLGAAIIATPARQGVPGSNSTQLQCG